MTATENEKGRPKETGLKKYEGMESYRIIVSESSSKGLHEACSRQKSTSSGALRDILTSMTIDEICQLAETAGILKDKDVFLGESTTVVLLGIRITPVAKQCLEEAANQLKTTTSNPAIISMKSKKAYIIRVIIKEIIKGKGLPGSSLKPTKGRAARKDSGEFTENLDNDIRGPWIAESLVQSELGRRHVYIYPIVNPATGEVYEAPVSDDPPQNGWIFSEENMRKKIEGKIDKRKGKNKIKDIYFPEQGLPILKRFPADAVTFRIRNKYNATVETKKVIDEITRAADISKTDFYRRAIRNFKGLNGVLETFSQGADYYQICFRLQDEEKTLIDKMPVVQRHNYSVSDVLRSAIYQEIERYLEQKK
jgi:hypothetical protein